MIRKVKTSSHLSAWDPNADYWLAPTLPRVAFSIHGHRGKFSDAELQSSERQILCAAKHDDWSSKRLMERKVSGAHELAHGGRYEHDAKEQGIAQGLNRHEKIFGF